MQIDIRIAGNAFIFGPTLDTEIIREYSKTCQPNTAKSLRLWELPEFIQGLQLEWERFDFKK